MVICSFILHLFFSIHLWLLFYPSSKFLLRSLLNFMHSCNILFLLVCIPSHFLSICFSNSYICFVRALIALWYESNSLLLNNMVTNPKVRLFYPLGGLHICDKGLLSLENYWLMVHILCTFNAAWGVNLLFFLNPDCCNRGGSTWWTVPISYTWCAILTCTAWVLFWSLLMEFISKHQFIFLYKTSFWIDRNIYFLIMQLLFNSFLPSQVSDNLLHDPSSNLETLIFCSQTLRSKVISIT